MFNKNKLSGLRDLIATVAPTIATALGSPIAGVATKFIASKLLGDENATVDQVAKALKNATPETMLQLKTIEQEFLIEMERLGIKREELDAADRDSARQRQVDTKDNTPDILAAVYTFGYFYILVTFFSGELKIPQGQDTIAVMLITVLTAGQAQILNFYFGSSAGSKSKTGLIKTMTGKP